MGTVIVLCAHTEPPRGSADMCSCRPRPADVRCTVKSLGVLDLASDASRGLACPMPRRQLAEAGVQKGVLS